MVSNNENTISVIPSYWEVELNILSSHLQPHPLRMKITLILGHCKGGAQIVTVLQMPTSIFSKNIHPLFSCMLVNLPVLRARLYSICANKSADFLWSKSKYISHDKAHNI